MNTSFVHDPHTTISNEETLRKELLENLKEMFPRYYKDTGMFSEIKPSATH